MAAEWTIEGESGAAWDDTLKTFEERKMERAQFNFGSLITDTLTFTISAQDLATETLPDYTQKIVIYRNGTRYFTGHVTNRQISIEPSKQVCNVTVSGPWWWMEKITFTASSTDGTGATADRATIQFGSSSSGQDLKTSIENVITRCVALGVPMAGFGDPDPPQVATMTTFPRITLNQSTCAQTLSELIRLCTDAMATFDYAPATPRLLIRRRRTDATTETLTIGTSPIASMDINPKIEMEVEEVVLPYVTRASDGRTQYQEQTFGSTSSPYRKRQVITISGPELDTYLPNFQYDTANIGTSTIYSDAVQNMVAEKIGVARNLFTSISGGVSITLVDSRGCTWPVNYVSTRRSFIPAAKLVSTNGTDITSTHTVLTSGTVPPWLTSQPIQATLSGYIYRRHVYDYGCNSTYYSKPSNWNDVDWTDDTSGFTSSQSTGDKVLYAWRNFSIEVTAIQGTGGTFYAPADYTFINPPAGLAQFLKECADFVPYEGSINLHEQDVPASRYSGKCININGSLSEYATMKAMVASEQVLVETGQTFINLGTPARYDYATLVDRIRRTSQDNIVYL